VTNNTITITIDDDVTNQVSGHIKIDRNGRYDPLTATGRRVVYNGMFTNHGWYQSDPATNVFAGGLTIGPTGYFGSAGGVANARRMCNPAALCALPAPPCRPNAGSTQSPTGC
jgi:hypothetical protein